jgi:A/G-specific adenine glycosylase
VNERAPALADWYARHGRHELPWRASRDRWPVLVSEVMLHQTQVARVLAMWPAFMTRFPDVETAAAAGPAAVIAAWDRLGYPRRARWLWQSAVHVTEHG